MRLLANYRHLQILWMSVSQLYDSSLMSCARYHVTMAAGPGSPPHGSHRPAVSLPTSSRSPSPATNLCPRPRQYLPHYITCRVWLILRLANSGICKGGMKYVFLFPDHEPPSSSPNKNLLQSYQSGDQICSCCVLPILFIITAARYRVLEVR